ncbi:MAG TPA: cation diffusion facilitator family transporter [Lautropia sp.]|nr:cation diffusion facilitator family transporter [Lautropia sp.]
MGIGHAHHHEAGHGHGHGHAPLDWNRSFAIGVVLNTAFVAVEVVLGIVSGSMALIADAGHNLSDVLSLLLAWGAATLAKRPATERFTYGYRSSTILAALANAVLLLVALGVILAETVQRLGDPQPIDTGLVMIVAGIGIVVNAGTALLFAKGRHGDLNIRGAFLHMAADALISLGVVVSAALVWWTGALWIDPVTSLVIVAVIGWGTWGLLKESVQLGMMGVPHGIDAAAVRTYLSTLEGVNDVHDLHIWSMSTTQAALTAHLVMPGTHPGDAFLSEVTRQLDHRFGIAHATLQVERDAAACQGCEPRPSQG